MSMHIVRVHYSGHVQGVGFRYTSKKIASGYEVIGWVRNRSDGRVEMECGSHNPEELADFLEEMKTGELNGNIQEIEAEELENFSSTSTPKSFSIA